MSKEASVEALIAARRFGLGPRPGDLARLADDPRGAVLADVSAARPPVVAPTPELPSSQAALKANAVAEEQRRRRARSLPMMADVDLQIEQTIFDAEARVRFARLIGAEVGFAERLVLFWSNHFCIAITKGRSLQVQAGAFEREAIRPHVFGRFADMLKAVEQHPAMLHYLDNRVSAGPTSRRAPPAGLNENLAREILELHTLGVDGGYAQADILALARIISGWTFTWPEDDATSGGVFTFAIARHEPGAQRLLGRSFADGGVEQGLAAMDFIARHPSTARHVAGKLARHFVADDAPPALVDRLAKIFVDTEGDLAEVSTALVRSEEAWTPQAQKIRTPVEFVAAAARLFGAPQDLADLVSPLARLGQPLWSPPGPNGFPDDESHWGSAASLRARLDYAAQAGAMADVSDPNRLLDEAIGPVASPEARQAVRRAETRAQGAAILMMSPEFQRR